jgi:spoIIIJ-associated protein
MENLEISAKTVEEATQKALTQLNVGLDEVEVTVLTAGKSGILGLGSEDARIRVRLINPKKDLDTEAQELAEDVLDNLLRKMGLQAKITVDNPKTIPGEEEDAEPVIFNISGDDLGILIGRRGQTLDALQYFVRLITSRKTQSKTPIVIDVEGYKQRRYEDLRVLAANVANQVKATGSSIRLEPMSAYERRIIHLALADDAGVKTESSGEGNLRRVVVSPKRKK